MLGRKGAFVIVGALVACAPADEPYEPRPAAEAETDDPLHWPSGDEPDEPVEPMDTTTTGDEPEPPSSFIDNPDGGGVTIECDVFEQDCPSGTKCMPWANDGGSWNATKCTPIAIDPGQVGDACLVEGTGVSGIDTCDLGMMCWEVDPATLEGHCIGMCIGDAVAPTCADPNARCSISCSGVLTLCLPQCNPLLQDCHEGQGCYPMAGGYFSCAPDVSGDEGLQGDPCDFLNVCDPGLTCLSSDAVGCDETVFGCCSSYCSIVDGLCPGDLECVPYFNEGQAPPGLAEVGVCLLATTP